MVIVGTDRVTANGDVANKIGTYLKALAAKDNDVPFYVALPSLHHRLDAGQSAATFPSRNASPGRSAENDRPPAGRHRRDGGDRRARQPAANPGFDVTPARLVTGFITERGTCAATAQGLRSLFPKDTEGFRHAVALVRHRGPGIRDAITPPKGVNEDLALRTYTTRLLGSDPRLVLHGGGNTSVKTTVKDMLGEDVEVICVKGSGWDMGEIEPAGLPAVRLEPLRKLRALDETVRRGHGQFPAHQSAGFRRRPIRRSRPCCTPSCRTNSSTTPIPPPCWR